jgi:hypothetical protein
MCPFSKQGKVDFLPRSHDVEHALPSPKPSIEFFPTWMKAIPFLPFPYGENPKLCPPFMDAFSHGYTQELICDVEISVHGKDEEGNDIIQFDLPQPIIDHQIEPIGSRGALKGAKNLMPKFHGFYRSEQHWESIWEPQTPSGYSTLYTHPLNRYDLPFMTMSGIVDTDVYPVHGPIPFLIKEGFTGLIPAGTPIYQIIFIKRENWKSGRKKFIDSAPLLRKLIIETKKTFQGGYKKLFWQKKSFE